MKRRALLKNGILIGLGAWLPLEKILAGRGTRPFHRWQMGELELTVITDGLIRMSPVQPNVAPAGPPAAVDSLLAGSFRSTKEVDLAINILAIRKGSRTILVDTGVGTGFGMNLGSESGWLPQSLKDADIAADSVTDIIITHAHPDHIGGLFYKDGTPVFPHAEVYLSAVEHAFWTAEHPDFSHSTLDHTDLLRQVLDCAHRTLAALKPRLHLFNDKDELLGCIRLERAEGHTPGHTMVHVFSGEEELVHIADLLHSDVLLAPHPEWGFSGDTDIALAAATRRRVLSVLAEKRVKIFSYHLPWPGVGHVRRQGDGFEWVAEAYAVPG